MAVDVLGARPVVRGHHESGVFLRLGRPVLGALDDALERNRVDDLVADRGVVGFADGVLRLREVAFHQVQAVGNHLETRGDLCERCCESAGSFDGGRAGLAVPVGGDVLLDAFGEYFDCIACLLGKAAPTIRFGVDNTGVDILDGVINLLVAHGFEWVEHLDRAFVELVAAVLAEQP